MNQVMEVLTKRKSIRAYEEREIPAEVRAEILKATLRAPTAGNLMLYSILEITDQPMKDKLAITCDNQPFIARGAAGLDLPGRLSALVRLFSRLGRGGDL